MATRRESGEPRHSRQQRRLVAARVHPTNVAARHVHHANVRDRIRRAGLRKAFLGHLAAVGKLISPADISATARSSSCSRAIFEESGDHQYAVPRFQLLRIDPVQFAVA